MSKIIKRKVKFIFRDENNALILFYPPAFHDRYPVKTFHCLSLDELKALDIHPDDVISLEAKGAGQYKILEVERTARCQDSCKCEVESQPVLTKPKELNMHERINLARSAITGLNLRSANKLFDDILLAAREEAKIPAPEGSDTDGSTKNVGSSKS